MRDVNLMTEELLTAKRDGLACIVDAGAEAMGRDLEFIKQASMKANLPVVAVGGFYTQPFYPKEITVDNPRRFLVHSIPKYFRYVASRK